MTAPPVTYAHAGLALRLGMGRLFLMIRERVHELATTRLSPESDLSVAEFRRRVWPAR